MRKEHKKGKYITVRDDRGEIICQTSREGFKGDTICDLVKLVERWMEMNEHQWKDRGIWPHRDGEVMMDSEPVWYYDDNDETVFQATEQLTATQVEVTNEKTFGGKEQHGADARDEGGGTLSVRDRVFEWFIASNKQADCDSKAECSSRQ